MVLAIPMHGDHMPMGNEERASWAGVNKVEGRERNGYDECGR